ncbi:MAG: ribbon-helix-helix protein, CopG family [Archangium sp.]|nr:ribbon-helix-helix protein, CopG family [Archangium sp.]MDP3156270.1 ribbon-helix-helix protein, CopG family [Archangium sp.]MDP3570314.1 ribbon-helix-helix protein, CopG family [Archangium sp.]
MSQFPIDVDAEAIFLDGGWYTREDLSRRIRAMLDSGDFNVARPSMALQELTQMMMGVRTMAFRSTPELADALTALATRLGQSVGGVIREAVTQYITDANSDPMASQQQQPAPVQLTSPPRSEETVRAAMPTSTTSEELPKVIVEPPAVIAGPGALKAAGVDPLELTQRKAAAPAAPGEPDGSEQRWFKQ